MTLRKRQLVFSGTLKNRDPSVTVARSIAHGAKMRLSPNRRRHGTLEFAASLKGLQTQKLQG
jgi:hypothetical protein